MILPLSPLNAAPSLFVTWQRVRRAPTARLAVGYRILPRTILPPSPARCRPLRPLGASLCVDRLLGGGIVGEALPLSIERHAHVAPLLLRTLEADQRYVLGVFLDVTG